MSRSKHSEAPIIAVSKRAEAGRTAEKCGVSKLRMEGEVWRHGGRELQKVRTLEDENSR